MKTRLPHGGVSINPAIKRSIGGWVEMEYDASTQRLGLTWLRAKDGFGDSGEREDWVADIPSGCLSVNRYNGEPWKSGFTVYNSFDDAVIGETRRALKQSRDSLAIVSRRSAKNWRIAKR